MEAPKFSGQLRPGAQLSAPYQVRAAAALESCLLPIAREFEKAEGVQFAARLRTNPQKKVREKGILQPDGWNRMHQSIQELRPQVIGVGDVAGFYSCVGGSAIEVALERIKCPSEAIDTLVAFAEQGGMGLPQGSSVSDVIAMLVLQQCLLECRKYGICVIAYSDDLRITARSKLDVGRDLSHVTEIFAEAGLPLAPEKCRVYDGLGAQLVCHGTVPDGAEVERYFPAEMPYDSVDQNISDSQYGKSSGRNDSKLPFNSALYAQERFLGDALGSAHLDRLAVRDGACQDLDVFDSIQRDFLWLLPEAVRSLNPSRKKDVLHELATCDRLPAYTRAELLRKANREPRVSCGNAMIAVLREIKAPGHLIAAAANAATGRPNSQLGTDALAAFGRVSELGPAVELIACMGRHLPCEEKARARRTVSDRSPMCRVAADKFFAA